MDIPLFEKKRGKMQNTAMQKHQEGNLSYTRLPGYFGFCVIQSPESAKLKAKQRKHKQRNFSQVCNKLSWNWEINFSLVSHIIKLAASYTPDQLLAY
jgi:hypothetical protein